MSDAEWRVLVPVEVLEGETVPESVMDLLATLPVVVLGYHVLPEQTPPGQARLQFEDQAQRTLDDLADAFAATGGAADTRLVFTHDEEQTVDRVAEETACAAILLPNPAPAVEDVLVPLRGAVDVSRVTAFVAALLGGRDIDVTLFNVAESEDDRADGTALLEDAAERLRDLGLPAGAVGAEVSVSETPVQAIADAAADHDAVVMGESEPSLRTLLFGESADQVAAQSLGPVIAVRRARDPADAGE